VTAAATWNPCLVAAASCGQDGAVPDDADDLIGLVGRFRPALVSPGGRPPRSARADAVARDLLARWTEPHRRYHTVTHLRAALDAADVLMAELDLAVPDPGAVRLAIWFHDAVYDGRPGADEQASAELAERALTGLGLPAARVSEVSRLVRLTATHSPGPADPAGQVLSDADLAVLGADPAGYHRYAVAVRQEYAHVPDPAFRAGRALVLRGLLAADPLFRTLPGRRRWEPAARRNLTDELTELTS
jgi:predicted metal-dependent HD superfamily phosphohydrolase